MSSGGRDARYSSQAWRDVRAIVFDRDRGLCRIKGDGCTQRATEVDHIVSPKQGGAFYDPANLRASCKACNSSRGTRARLDNGWRLARTEVIVAGPGSPELEGERSRGSAIVDSLELERAVRSPELAAQLRRMIVTAIRKGELAGLDRVVVVCRKGEGVPPHHLDLDNKGGRGGGPSRDWLA